MSDPSKQEKEKFKENFWIHYNTHGYEGFGEIFNDTEKNKKIRRWIDTIGVYTPVWARNKNGELYIESLEENVTFPKGAGYMHPRKRKEQRKSRKKTRKNRKRRM